MIIDHVTGQVLSGPLENVYVYEAPVRLWHWVTVVCFTVLAVTGYLIGAPLPSIAGETTGSFFMGWIRTVHFVAAMLMIAFYLIRVYYAFVGNEHARSIFIVPVWSGRWWRGLFGQAMYYLFLRKEAEHWTGHNPLAQAAMCFMFNVGTVVLILTGLGLYAHAYSWGSSWMSAFGWVTVLLGSPQAVRTVHHLAMWYVVIFAIVHTYMVFREDIMSGETVISTMINGIRMFKNGSQH